MVIVHQPVETRPSSINSQKKLFIRNIRDTLHRLMHSSAASECHRDRLTHKHHITHHASRKHIHSRMRPYAPIVLLYALHKHNIQHIFHRVFHRRHANNAGLRRDAKLASAMAVKKISRKARARFVLALNQRSPSISPAAYIMRSICSLYDGGEYYNRSIHLPCHPPNQATYDIIYRYFVQNKRVRDTIRFYVDEMDMRGRVRAYFLYGDVLYIYV